MSDFLDKSEKVLDIITKYSLLIGGVFSFYNAFFISNTTWEMLAWTCAGSFALSGFSQIFKLENKINSDEDNIS